MAHITFDTSGIDAILRDIERLGGDVRPIVEKVLSETSQIVIDDTVRAIEPSKLPAQGKYSEGTTSRTVIRKSNVEWFGETYAQVKVGFDHYENPHAIFLIYGAKKADGTPRMNPDNELRAIYKDKAYRERINEILVTKVSEELHRKWQTM